MIGETHIMAKMGELEPPMPPVIYSGVPPAHHETTLGDGYLGSELDEGRSKMRYVSRLADSLS